MKYKLWHKKLGRYLNDDEMFNIGIGHDGKVYEYTDNCADGSSWLSKDNVTEEFEVHFQED